MILTRLLVASTLLQAPVGDSLSLTQAVDLALTHSFAAREARADAEAARAGVGETATQFIPRLSASVTANGFDRRLNPDYLSPVDPSLLNLSGQSYSTDLSASYSLLSTTRRLSLLQSRAQAASADEAEQAATNQLVRDVAVAYLSVVEADALADLAAEDVRRRENGLSEAREMVDAGRRAEYEVLRADAEKAQAQARKLEADNQRLVARAELERVVGVKLGEAFEVSFPELPEAPTAGESADQAREQAISHRPEIKASAADTRAALMSQRAASRSYLPSLNVFANWSRDLAPTEADLTVESFSYGASLSVVFGEEAATVWRARAARARTRGVETRAERLKYEIAVEAKRAALNYAHRTDERKARQQALDASRRAFENTAERYRLGVATQTERIDAEANLAQAESDFTRAEVALAKAIWELRYALGESVEVSP